MALGHYLSPNASQSTQFKYTCADVPWDLPEWFKLRAKIITCMKLSSLPLVRRSRHWWSVFPMQKSTTLHAIIITQSSWFSPLTIRYGRYFTKMSATTQATMGELMEKTRLKQMKPRELPWPPRLPPLKGSDHRSPTLWWSLFIFNIELKKVGLEVGGLIH